MVGGPRGVAGLLRGELHQAERCGVGRGGVEWVPGGGRIGSCEEEVCPGWRGMAGSQAEAEVTWELGASQVS